jgi:hypothetical protein
VISRLVHRSQEVSMKRTRTAGGKRNFPVSLLVAALALIIAAAGPATAGSPAIPCGEATAPQCGGQCPLGQRCIASAGALTSIGIFAFAACGNAREPVRHEAQGANGECECAEVRCGGAPLGQDQGCCNGRAFTLGTQGCCNGVLVDADTACECDGLSIDLAVTGCCGEEDNEQIFYPALQTCCQQPVTTEGCSGNVSTTSTFNLGFECCPGPVASASQFCDGQCAGSECASSGCCQCTDCIVGPQCAAGGPTLIEGIPIACAVGCFSEACNFSDLDLVQHPGGICTESGSCLATVAPVPAATHAGLVLAIGALVAASGLAFVRRRSRTRG